MAALSSRRKEVYDVFLSHRGSDTKRDFAILLWKELEEHRITTFLDDRSILAGDHAFWSRLEEAMQTAEWGVVVLSPRFFASGYCMKELKVFLDRGRAIPIAVGGLTVGECSADLIVGRAGGTVWEQHGGRLWKSCSTGGQVWSEAEWREVVGRLKGIAMLDLERFDGFWDRCISEVVQIITQKLGRPVVSRKSSVDLTPFHRNIDFLGREDELAGVAEGLAKSFGRVCITGMGGMGKTQLALEYAYRHKQEYRRILWVNADGGSLKRSYIGLATHLGVRVSAPQGDSLEVESVAVANVREALENSAVPCLLVLDHVADQKDLAAVVPKSGPCHVIATSRLRALANFFRVRVGELSREDGLRLLRGQESFSEQEEQHLQELADKLGYRTHALAISSRLLAEGLRPSELLVRLVLDGPGFIDRELPDPIFGYQHLQEGTIREDATLEDAVQEDAALQRSSFREAAQRLMAAAASATGNADLSGLALGSFPLDSGFEGSFPRLIAQLRILDLSKTRLTSVSSAVGQLLNLQTLKLEGNRLTSLPLQLRELSNLEALDLRNNKFQEVPLSIRGMSALVGLLLDGNKDLATLPDWLAESCPVLRELSVEACGLLGFPRLIKRLGSLRKLNLAGNKGLVLPLSLEDTSTNSLLIGGLEELSLASLGLDDEALACLEPLKHLRRLNLRNNALVSLPLFLAQLAELVELQVRITCVVGFGFLEDALVRVALGKD
jgi:hypothetical protein